MVGFAYTGPGLPEQVVTGPPGTRVAVVKGRVAPAVAYLPTPLRLQSPGATTPQGMTAGTRVAVVSGRVAIALTTFPAIYRRYSTGEVVTPRLAVMREYPPIIR